MPFNAYETTNPRLKKDKPFNDGASAGAAKVSSGGPRGREELRSLGERMGWTARELSMREINTMSADETLWHQAHNVEHWRDAFEREEVRRTNKQHMATWDVRRMWNGRASPEESEAAQNAGDLFARQHPTFERTIENAEKMIAYMAENDLDGTKAEGYTTAFNALLEAGQLVLAKPESADDFLRNHAELQDRRTPPLIAARNAKAEVTAEHFKAAASATARAGVIQVTTYPERERIGYGDHTRYSFRKLLDSLPADDYKKRLIEDKSFAAAVDKLQNGNTTS